MVSTDRQFDACYDHTIAIKTLIGINNLYKKRMRKGGRSLAPPALAFHPTLPQILGIMVSQLAGRLIFFAVG